LVLKPLIYLRYGYNFDKYSIIYLYNVSCGHIHISVLYEIHVMCNFILLS